MAKCHLTLPWPRVYHIDVATAFPDTRRTVRVLALPLTPEAWGDLMLCRRKLEDTASGCLEVSFRILLLSAQCLGYGGLATPGLLLGLMDGKSPRGLFFYYSL